MTGVILCGGESSRMGTDKGMLQFQEQSWAQRAAQHFISLSMPFILSVNADQYLKYKQFFSAEQLIIDNQKLAVKGPLLGLLSVHKQLPTEDLFVLACDMIDMQIQPLEKLLNAYNNNKKHDTYLFEMNNVMQPLCTVYTASFLNKVLNKLNDGAIKRFGLRYLLKDYNNYIAHPSNEWLHYFNNYNSKEDLNSFTKQA